MSGVGGIEALAASAIQTAANATGADFDVLLRTARQESAFDPDARARTSSAAGLFQFIEQTWLATLKAFGAKHGFGEEAGLVREVGPGRYDVVDPAARRDILDLRFDPEASALMAGELTAQNAQGLRAKLGREPSAGELYTAHFLGVTGAGRLITAAELSPGAAADHIFPEAARANRSIFYESDGGARTVGQVLDVLSAKVEGAGERPRSPAAVREPDYTPQPGRLRGATRDLQPLDAGRGGGAPTAGVSRPPLELTPEVISILSQLDPLSTRSRKDDDDRQGFINGLS
ncbi:MAG: transglycosylase SLT domain-containing protein [Maricaulaceae bacterium]